MVRSLMPKLFESNTSLTKRLLNQSGPLKNTLSSRIRESANSQCPVGIRSDNGSFIFKLFVTDTESSSVWQSVTPPPHHRAKK